MFSSVTCGGVNIPDKKKKKQSLAHLHMPVQLLPSAVHHSHSRPLLLPFTIQLQRQEMCSGSVISVYCMQNQQAWNIEQSNYSPNEADLRHSQQWNTFQLQQTFSSRDFVWKRTLKNKQPLLCLFTVSVQCNLLVWTEWGETWPVMVSEGQLIVNRLRRLTPAKIPPKQMLSSGN